MPTYDLLVAGGGIAGCSVAREAALRGLTVALVDKDDLASGTSSRSTKLLHGGLRYLEHGHIGLVREALREREITARLAPHLARPLRFVVPAGRGSRPGRFIARIGVAVYDLLAGGARLGRGESVSAGEVARLLAGGGPGATGGVAFSDRQTDDARLTIAIARDAAERGAAIRTGHEVVSWLERRGRVAGARCLIRATGDEVTIEARAVVNATGPWADRLRALAGSVDPLLRPTRGTHLVLRNLGLRSAALFAGTEPKHRIFAIPWRGETLFGTTDVDDTSDPDAAIVNAGDVSFLLAEARRLFPAARLGPGDVLSTFAGLRPLIRTGGVSLAASREHRIVEERGLFTVAGGKLTTWRVIGADAADAVARALGRRVPPPAASATEPLPGGGPAPAIDDVRLAAAPEFARAGLVAAYGSEASELAAACAADRSAAQSLAPGEPTLVAQVDFAVRAEFARTVEDVAMRRLALGHDPRRASAAAAAIAARMRTLLGWSASQETEEIRALERTLARAAGPGPAGGAS